MRDSKSEAPAAGQLDRELRGTLAALQELGPTYEPELAAALVERLRHDGRAAVTRSRWERPPSWRRVRLPLAAAAAILIAAAALVSVGSVVPLHREVQAAPFDWNVITGPAACR